MRAMSVPAQPQSLLGTTLDELVAMFADMEKLETLPINELVSMTVRN